MLPAGSTNPLTGGEITITQDHQTEKEGEKSTEEIRLGGFSLKYIQFRKILRGNEIQHNVKKTWETKTRKEKNMTTLRKKQDSTNIGKTLDNVHMTDWIELKEVVGMKFKNGTNNQKQNKKQDTVSNTKYRAAMGAGHGETTLEPFRDVGNKPMLDMRFQESDEVTSYRPSFLQYRRNSYGTIWIIEWW